MKFLDVPQSGSIAGTVHSHNRAGQYTRNRRAPVQPIGTGRRAFIRSTFGAASTAWAALTDAERAAWVGFANAHPYTDALGQSIILTGQQMFVAMQINLVNSGQAATTTPPATTTLDDIVPVAFSAGVSSGLNWTASTDATTCVFVIACSMQVSPGRMFNKTFWQPLGGTGYPTGLAGVYTLLTADYAAQFGTPVAGMKVFGKWTLINAGGWASVPQIQSAVFS